MNDKIYIDMIVHISKDGKVTPLFFIWENGIKYAIDRVLDVRKAASLKAGGVGIRYLCRIQGQERNLFYEIDRWFIEGKD